MGCTMILVGKKASLENGNIIGRNDDSGSVGFTPKKFCIISSDKQPEEYVSKISHCKIELPANPMPYSACPSAGSARGIWGACGVNQADVGMTATVSITSNPRVYAADPLVYYHAYSGEIGGVGEEDFVTIVLPYIHSAREGVIRTGKLLEQFGTYESNGIAFSDSEEIWYMETIGGHHWIARRVPDDSIAVIANQLGIDDFDLNDALYTQKDYMCSADLYTWMIENSLIKRNAESSNTGFDDLDPELQIANFNPRLVFGSDSDKDRVYNYPRVWDIQRLFNNSGIYRDDKNSIYSPESNRLPWCMPVDRPVSIDDLQRAFSKHFQGTEFDPYLKGSGGAKKYRPVGINRTNLLGVIQHRKQKETILWLSFGSTIFSPLTPYYIHVRRIPEYLSNTEKSVTTENAYWCSRLLACMTDESWETCYSTNLKYQTLITNRTRMMLAQNDRQLQSIFSADERLNIMEQANEASAQSLQHYQSLCLGELVKQKTLEMKCAYDASEAY